MGVRELLVFSRFTDELYHLVVFGEIIVSSKEDAEAASGYRIDPIDLNSFLGDEGKIYGYQGLKVNIVLLN